MYFFTQLSTCWISLAHHCYILFLPPKTIEYCMLYQYVYNFYYNLYYINIWGHTDYYCSRKFHKIESYVCENLENNKRYYKYLLLAQKFLLNLNLVKWYFLFLFKYCLVKTMRDNPSKNHIDISSASPLSRSRSQATTIKDGNILIFIIITY